MSKVGVYPFFLGKRAAFQQPKPKIQPTKIVGFTGSSSGMTNKQRQAAKTVISVLRRSYLGFSHGDCIGSDEQIHKIARANGFPIIIHPPINEAKRAFCKGDLTHKPEEYLNRNKNIVSESTVMIATPNSKEEKRRSGTWASIRYARKLGKPIYFIFPDGSVKLESQEGSKVNLKQRSR